VSGAAGGCGRKTGSIRELGRLHAVMFESEVEIIFGVRAYTMREKGAIPVPTQSEPRYQDSAQPPSRPSSFSCPRS